MNKNKAIFLLLTILSGIFLLYHHTFYQIFLSPGDHGRDLYAFQATMQGGVPYQDYWWVYGPLMPYYYSLFYKLLGVSINSVLIGKVALNLISGLFFFSILSLLFSQLYALIAALWFWAFFPDFFFTYNHAGGITLLMAITYMLFSYVIKHRNRYLYLGLLGIFLLSLVKINFGLAALFVFILTVLISDKFNKNILTADKKKFYITAALAVPFLIFIIYFLLLKGLPIYEIRQCLPYLSSDHPHNASAWNTFRMWWDAIAININSSWANRLFALLLNVSIFRILYLFLSNKYEQKQKYKIIFSIAICVAFYIVNIHEYVVSGVIYRTFWAKPFSVLLVFLFIGFMFQKFSKLAQTLLLITLFAIIVQRYHDDVKYLQKRHIPEQYLTFERGKILTSNSPYVTLTMKYTVEFLNAQLTDDETFFALPYDPIYYFLTDKPSPTRQLIFFEHINIPEEQEHSVIKELENNNVNYILLSNRAVSGEAGLGTLGETYCPVLHKYITANFQEIMRFGDWVNPPGWAWNHGTVIFKRISDNPK